MQHFRSFLITKIARVCFGFFCSKYILPINIIIQMLTRVFQGAFFEFVNQKMYQSYMYQNFHQIKNNLILFLINKHQLNKIFLVVNEFITKH